MGSSSYMNLLATWEKLTQTQFSPLSSLSHISIFCFEVQTKYYRFSYCVSVFLGDTVFWWVKEFGYTVTWLQIQLASIAIMDHYNYNTPAWGRMTHSTWIYLHCKLFLSKFIKKGKFSFKCLLVAWEFQMSGYQITGSLQYIEVWHTTENGMSKSWKLKNGTETVDRSRYSNWLQAGWLRGRSSSPSRGRIFPPLHVVQTSSGAHPAPYPMGTGGSFPRGKTAGAWSWPLTSN
jgi:hypothetical protein